MATIISKSDAPRERQLLDSAWPTSKNESRQANLVTPRCHLESLRRILQEHHADLIWDASVACRQNELKAENQSDCFRWPLW